MPDRIQNFDAIVVGGGSAGVSAACGARQSGAHSPDRDLRVSWRGCDAFRGSGLVRVLAAAPRAEARAHRRGISDRILDNLGGLGVDVEHMKLMNSALASAEGTAAYVRDFVVHYDGIDGYLDMIGRDKVADLGKTEAAFLLDP